MPKVVVYALGVVSVVLFGVLQACAPGVSGTSKGGKSCLDCHEEYRQRYTEGIVHRPVKSGDCAGCHRRHGLVGGAYLQQEGAALCFQCHQTFVKQLNKAPKLHAPVSNGNCSACHQPHNSPHENLLNRPQEQQCFVCHAQDEFNRKYIHQPMRQGCKTCHETHGSQFDKLLIKKETELCQDCHSIKKKSFLLQHGGYPVTQSCSTCHSVHSADNPKFLKQFTHPPVAEKDCNSCHVAVDSADPFAVTDKSATLCYQCHDQQQTAFKSNNAHSPVRNGDCFACHDPHASDFSGVIKTDPQRLCIECHSFPETAKNRHPELKSKKVHAPVKDGDCLSCHGPHLAGAGQKVLLRSDPNKLCLQCHDEKAKRQVVNHQPAASGDCIGCHMPHESRHSALLTKPQRALCGECHQLVGETLALPSLHRPFVNGDCSACHEPHGAQKQKLLIATGMDGCGQCHGTIETERQVSTHKPFKEGRCELCHQPHGSQQPFLLARASHELCVTCHSDRAPVDGTPGGHQNCTVCHSSHGNNEVGYLLRQQPDLCLGCHDVNQYWSKGVGHAPAVSGQCDACHDPHVPQRRPSGKDVDLCGQCHAVDRQTLAASHKGIIPEQGQCLSCHDPHGGPDASLTLPVKHAPFADGDCDSCHLGGGN